MPNYNNYFIDLGNLYSNSKTKEQITKKFAKGLKERYGLKYIPFRYIERTGPFYANHPEGGQMLNWSQFPPIETLDPSKIIDQVLDKNGYLPYGEPSYLPDIPMLMNLNPVSHSSSTLVRGHEFKHMLAHKMPFDLATIFIFKTIQRSKLNNLWGENYALNKKYIAVALERWLNFKYETGKTRIQMMFNKAFEFDKLLNAHENDENLEFSTYPAEDILLDIYGDFISQME